MALMREEGEELMIGEGVEHIMKAAARDIEIGELLKFDLGVLLVFQQLLVYLEFA